MPDFTLLEPGGFRTELETLADDVDNKVFPPSGDEGDLFIIELTASGWQWVQVEEIVE